MTEQKQREAPEREEKRHPTVPPRRIEEQEIEPIPTERDEIDELVEEFLKEDVSKDAEERIKERKERKGE